ncbi:MAG TPA: methyltransferase domain-containing protein [Vicinamibacterales bacterium]|nr:methyltransferase domain-containing protein [Vicinamibacterales bacterium]
MTAADIIYGPLTPIYDVVCGAMLQPGRRRAIAHLNPAPSETILEVGVGTGLDLEAYRSRCRVVGIDLSLKMMLRAKKRLDREIEPRVDFLQMDAAHLAFPDASFDAVYVPYTINVVPDPVAVGRELVRVCRRNGRIVMLNHFDGVRETTNMTNAIAGRLAEKFSVNWHLDAETFVRDLGLSLVAVESVNVPRLSSILVCRKDAH